jgi:hypothetical protein
VSAAQLPAAADVADADAAWSEPGESVPLAGLMAGLAVLRDGETPFDHADPDAPAQGPLTAGADLLTVLSYDQLRCLHARMSTVRADYTVLRSGEGWSEQRSARGG